MSEPLKLLFLATEFPYPPTHGGRADTWRRICAFAEAGVQILLVCWSSERRGGAPTATELERVRQVVSDLEVIPVHLGIVDLAWRLMHLGRVPSLASARLPRGATRGRLLRRVLAFQPHAIWLDGVWPGACARVFSEHLHVPFFFRSHNIEHRYMARQAALASSFKYRLRLWLTVIGLARFETDLSGTRRMCSTFPWMT